MKGLYKILTFINPGASTIWPEASTHLWVILGYIFIVGFSKGNSGPNSINRLKFPALVGNSTEYSLLKLISVTLIKIYITGLRATDVL